ncbi:MAG: efflux RND transporter periplasmic adaptor subunit [Nibricoccus sp.]
MTGGLLLALGAAGWFGYQQSQPVAVVGPIVRGPAVQAVPANILVSEEFRMEIKSESGGRIIKSHVQLGSEVKAGDVLFEIDPKDLELEIERWEADYKAAKDRIELGSPIRFEIATAEETIRNHTRLVEQGRLAQVELDRSKRALIQTQDRLAAENINNRQTLDNFENTLKTKRRQLEKMRVLAPDDGTVSEIFAINGELVTGGQLLARVISKARLVQAQISEENIAGVRPGLAANVQLLGYGGKLFNGKVARVLPGADERTKRYTAFLTLDIDEVLLAPGLTGEATIVIDRHEGTLLAERRSMLGHALFVVRDGVARYVPVVVGYANMKYTEIISGVQEGDQVIVANPAGFRDGQKVRTVRETSR